MPKHKNDDEPQELEKNNILSINQIIIDLNSHSKLSSKLKFYNQGNLFFNELPDIKKNVSAWLKHTIYRACDLRIKFENGFVLVCNCFYEDEYSTAGHLPYWEVFMCSFKEC
jgi:hypothetical protein